MLTIGASDAPEHQSWRVDSTRKKLVDKASDPSRRSAAREPGGSQKRRGVENVLHREAADVHQGNVLQHACWQFPGMAVVIYITTCQSPRGRQCGPSENCLAADEMNPSFSRTPRSGISPNHIVPERLPDHEVSVGECAQYSHQTYMIADTPPSPLKSHPS